MLLACILSCLFRVFSVLLFFCFFRFSFNALRYLNNQCMSIQCVCTFKLPCILETKEQIFLSLSSLSLLAPPPHLFAVPYVFVYAIHHKMHPISLSSFWPISLRFTFILIIQFIRMIKYGGFLCIVSIFFIINFCFVMFSTMRFFLQKFGSFPQRVVMIYNKSTKSEDAQANRNQAHKGV